MNLTHSQIHKGFPVAAPAGDVAGLVERLEKYRDFCMTEELFEVADLLTDAIALLTSLAAQRDALAECLKLKCKHLDQETRLSLDQSLLAQKAEAERDAALKEVERLAKVWRSNQNALTAAEKDAEGLAEALESECHRCSSIAFTASKEALAAHASRVKRMVPADVAATPTLEEAIREKGYDVFPVGSAARLDFSNGFRVGIAAAKAEVAQYRKAGKWADEQIAALRAELATLRQPPAPGASAAVREKLADLLEQDDPCTYADDKSRKQWRGFKLELADRILSLFPQTALAPTAPSAPRPQSRHLQRKTKPSMNPPTPNEQAGQPDAPTSLILADKYTTMPLNTITFHQADRLCMTITADGRLVAGEGLSEDEATQGMFAALQELWKNAAPPASNELALLRQPPAPGASAAVREKVEALRRRHHVEEEDCWYSCPESGECCDDSKKGCNCGASEHNAKVDAILSLLAPTAPANGSQGDVQPWMVKAAQDFFYDPIQPDYSQWKWFMKAIQSNAPTPARTAHAGEWAKVAPLTRLENGKLVPATAVEWNTIIAERDAALNEVEKFKGMHMQCEYELADLKAKHAPAPSAAGVDRQKVMELLRDCVVVDDNHKLDVTTDFFPRLHALAPTAPASGAQGALREALEETNAQLIHVEKLRATGNGPVPATLSPGIIAANAKLLAAAPASGEPGDDTKRLDWFIENLAIIERMHTIGDGCVYSVAWRRNKDSALQRTQFMLTPREAIDAAMSTTPARKEEGK